MPISDTLTLAIMTLDSGTHLGGYEVIEPLGKGGMGEVYRARDTRLQREVAIKVLPDEFAQDDERLERFEREAKLLASLNHPNIASIYGLESNALVLELVEGPTLAERIQQGPIPVDEAIVIAKQIADALEAGHEAGVIHRDLKPANIKLKEDGTVKVLDYGLAKAVEGDAATSENSELSQSPTLTRQGTQIGVILGTAGYMSPEQAKGKRVDKRTDIWAFGAVVYEMLTAKRAFGGDDVSETLASILKLTPDWSALPSDIPTRLRELLERCLEKNSRVRWRDIGDVRVELERTSTEPRDATIPAGAGRRARHPALWIAGAAVSMAVSFALGSRLLAPSLPAPSVMRFNIDIEPLADSSAEYFDVALSRDGRHLLYEANGQIYLRPTDAAEAIPIPGTEGGSNPFLSPRGERVAFWAENQLRTVSVNGGVPSVVADFPLTNIGWWSEEGELYFGVVGPGPIHRVAETGGTPEVWAELEDYLDLDWPVVLPGGEWVLFSAALPRNERVDDQIVAQSVSTGERKVILSGGRFARYVPTGHLIYFQDFRLWGVGFDLGRVEVTGDPVQLVEAVRTDLGGEQFVQAAFAVADDGSLVYVSGDETRLRALALIDLDTGAVEELNVPKADYLYPRIAPDGRRLLVGVREEHADALWIHDLSGTAAPRQLILEDSVLHGVWTPDGERVTFAVGGDLYETRADGTGAPELLSRGSAGPSSWTRDGEFLAHIVDTGGENGGDVWTLRAEDRRTESFYEASGQQADPEFSPDGKWLAYTSIEAWPPSVWVQPFPPTGGRTEIGHGYAPLWSPDGHKLFYATEPGELVSVSVSTESGFSFGRPVPLGITSRFVDARFLGSYDITPDGRKLVVVRDPEASEGSAVPRVHIVLNWHEELKQLVPTGR